MVDKIQKALAKLSAKELNAIEQLLAQIQANQLADLDIKQLKGNKNIYRVRKGGLRIIFTKSNQGEISILLISRRNEKTYKDF